MDWQVSSAQELDGLSAEPPLSDVAEAWRTAACASDVHFEPEAIRRVIRDHTSAPRLRLKWANGLFNFRPLVEMPASRLRNSASAAVRAMMRPASCGRALQKVHALGKADPRGRARRRVLRRGLVVRDVRHQAAGAPAAPVDARDHVNLRATTACSSSTGPSRPGCRPLCASRRSWFRFEPSRRSSARMPAAAASASWSRSGRGWSGLRLARGGDRGLADERRRRHPAPIGGPLDGARLGVGQPEAELAATKAIGSDARRRRTEWPPLG